MYAYVHANDTTAGIVCTRNRAQQFPPHTSAISMTPLLVGKSSGLPRGVFTPVLASVKLEALSAKRIPVHISAQRSRPTHCTPTKLGVWFRVQPEGWKPASLFDFVSTSNYNPRTVGLATASKSPTMAYIPRSLGSSIWVVRDVCLPKASPGNRASPRDLSFTT